MFFRAAGLLPFAGRLHFRLAQAKMKGASEASVRAVGHRARSASGEGDDRVSVSNMRHQTAERRRQASSQLAERGQISWARSGSAPDAGER